jgi:hypothetical protein
LIEGSFFLLNNEKSPKTNKQTNKLEKNASPCIPYVCVERKKNTQQKQQQKTTRFSTLTTINLHVAHDQRCERTNLTLRAPL